MMRRLMLSLALTSLCATHLFAAAASTTPDALAGEDDKAVPTAMPTAAADSRGPVSVSRSAQGAPAFQLPDFVVTGSGERKALARRDGQADGLDTSGGLKASPGEKGAGKDQMEAKAERSSAEEKTYTVKTDDAWLRASGGLAATAALDGYWGQATGPWAWSLQGAAHNTDGGPVAPGHDLAQRRQAALKGSLSYEAAELGLWEAEAQADGRTRRLSLSSDAHLEIEQSSALGAWHGQALGANLGANVVGQRGALRLGSLGTVYTEEGGSLGLDAEKTVAGHTGQTTLLAAFGVEALSQRTNGQRQLLAWKGDFRSRFEPFSRARLTLGLGLDAVTGDSNDWLLGPRVEWQQRLSPALGLNASFTSGLDISRLQAGQDWRLPNATLPVSKRVADIKLGLQWQVLPPLSLELGGFAKQNEGHFLADDPGRVGLWVDAPVRSYRELGVDLKERWDDASGSWWQEISARYLRPELNDLPGATPTFAPAWSGKLSLGGRQGAWHGWVAVDARTEVEGSLRGGWTLPAAAALSAELDYDVNKTWTVFIDGRNLTAAPWGDAPSIPDPAPYAGLGAEARF